MRSIQVRAGKASRVLHQVQAFFSWPPKSLHSHTLTLLGQPGGQLLKEHRHRAHARLLAGGRLLASVLCGVDRGQAPHHRRGLSGGRGGVRRDAVTGHESHQGVRAIGVPNPLPVSLASRDHKSGPAC